MQPCCIADCREMVLALHESFVLRYGECAFGLSCGKQKQRPLAVPCIRFGP